MDLEDKSLKQSLLKTTDDTRNIDNDSRFNHDDNNKHSSESKS